MRAIEPLVVVHGGPELTPSPIAISAKIIPPMELPASNAESAHGGNFTKYGMNSRARTPPHAAFKKPMMRKAIL